MTEEQWEWAREQAKSPMCRFLVENLDIAEAAGDEEARWEQFQIDYLNLARDHKQPPIAVSKTRQCGWSFLLAAEGVARVILYPGSLTNIVSINKDEAEEKIRYARQINECLFPEVRVDEWRTDNRGELETHDGSRIRSHACTPPRGRPGANHRLDEVAHYQKPQEIYNAAVPGITRKGSICCGSSPWILGGFHYDLMEEPEKYPDYVRMWIPWWHVFGMCKDVPLATAEAPGMPTQDRVEKFGTERLLFLYRNMPLDSFQVEFELAYADDNLSWLKWEEIVACTGPGEMDYIIANGYDEVLQALPKLFARKAVGPVFAGYDVARKKDLAVLTLLELVGGVYVCFAILILPNTRFADQESLLQDVTPIIRSGCIDETGMGMQLAENMHAYSFKWQGLTMTAPAKAEIAGAIMRPQFQAQAVIIPPDRDLQRDLHSVRRIVTAANNIVFSGDRDEELGHADRFWSLGLGMYSHLGQWQYRGPAPGAVKSSAEKIKAVNAATGVEQEVEVRPWDPDTEEPLLTGPIADAQAAERKAWLKQRFKHMRDKD